MEYPGTYHGEGFTRVYVMWALVTVKPYTVVSCTGGGVINPDERGTELVFRRQGTSYTGKDIQSPRRWFTADFSVRKTAARMSK